MKRLIKCYSHLVGGGREGCLGLNESLLAKNAGHCMFGVQDPIEMHIKGMHMLKVVISSGKKCKC